MLQPALADLPEASVLVLVHRLADDRLLVRPLVPQKFLVTDVARLGAERKGLDAVDGIVVGDAPKIADDDVRTSGTEAVGAAVSETTIGCDDRFGQKDHSDDGGTSDDDGLEHLHTLSCSCGHLDSDGEPSPVDS